MSEVQLSEHRPVGPALICRAFGAVAHVESKIDGLGDDTRRRPFNIHGRMAVANGGRPARQLSSWASAPVRRMADLPAIGADVVYVGRPDTILRCRAFYRSEGLTLAVHSGWMQLVRRRPLLRGMRIKKLLGSTELIVPRTVELGSAGRYSWVVEEMLDGRSLADSEWPEVAPALLGALLTDWRAAELYARPISQLLPPRALATALSMLDESDTELSARLRRLAARSGKALIGPTHGDPVPANVLWMSDDRLGLVDWERAAKRPIGHDVMKIVEWLADPGQVIDRLEVTAGTLGEEEVVSLRDQVVISGLIRLARSARPFSRATFAALRGDRQLGRTVQRNRQRTVELIARLVTS